MSGLRFSVKKQQKRLDSMSTCDRKFILGKNERGYYILLNDFVVALTSGRTAKEIVAYIDGLRDMLLINQNLQ